MTIYECDKFALSQAAVDQMSFIFNEQLAAFPDDPPIAAGISVMRPIVDGRGGKKQIMIGFVNKRQFREEMRESQDFVTLAGFEIIFDVPDADRPIFQQNAINFAPNKGFYLQPR